MMECYLDESGIHDDAPVCVIAGYFGGQGQWRRFNTLWQKVLDDADTPLEEFHAKDFVKTSRRRTTLEALAGAIGASRKIHPVIVGVVVSDFRSFSEDQRRFLTGAQIRNREFVSTGSPDRPYFLPFIHCVERLAGYASAGGKVHFFCGLDRPFARYATALFETFKSDPLAPSRKSLGKLLFPKARETPQLQAADLLAHLTYLDMQQRMRGGGWDRPPGGLLSKCIRNDRAPNDDFVYFNKHSMELTFKELESVGSV